VLHLTESQNENCCPEGELDIAFQAVGLSCGVAPGIDSFEKSASLNQVTIPDLWQQEAVSGLRSGKDVVVHAPTGAGKTLIFELWSNQGKNRGQAIYTVPTRALANDKLAEWRARGWNVGIATGDLSENLNAPVIVATLETQKNRLIHGRGPELLVVDEYQMLGDDDRGLNYELAMALAPSETQLLLLSGSVANPQDLVKWLHRIGRRAILVRHETRPVLQEEIYANQLSYHVPSQIKGYWPRLVAKTLAEDLGPILIFSPRRQAAEQLANEIARNLPTPNPLALSQEQKLLAGEHLHKLLKSRIAFHHSGLSYGARAGVVEPLAKAGQLRVVVATMGLAAGINFSLRSVALAGESYRRDQVEQPLKPEEILQMFGRAGRRGLDETGFVLISANGIRLLDARAGHLSRSVAVDWNALLGLMYTAGENGLDPYKEAVRIQERLFTSRPIVLGVEESLKNPHVPCGLRNDSERARHVRQKVRQFLNSKGAWENLATQGEKKVSEIYSVTVDPSQDSTVTLSPILSQPSALEKIGPGTLVPLEGQVFGKQLTAADRIQDGRLSLTKWVKRLIDWNGRMVDQATWDQKVVPVLMNKMAAQRTPIHRVVEEPQKVLVQISLADLTFRVPVDRHGVGIYRPLIREVLPADCAECGLVPICRNLPASTGVALLWRRLGLVDSLGRPTRRGRLTSFFSQGDGLAVAAALEDESYPLQELIFDLANLDGGFRFCGEENRWGGRLAMACHRIYKNQTIPGYLEGGVPPKYGAGAELVVAATYRDPSSKQAFVSDLLGVGDIDRIIIEWRSTLRLIWHSPKIDWARWQELQKLAEEILSETESPTLLELPPLEYHQTRRVDHKLNLRRN